MEKKKLLMMITEETATKEIITTMTTEVITTRATEVMTVKASKPN